MKKILLILFLIWTGCIFAKSKFHIFNRDENRNYTLCLNTYDKNKFSFEFYKHYEHFDSFNRFFFNRYSDNRKAHTFTSEYSFSVNWIHKDPYNDNKFNLTSNLLNGFIIGVLDMIGTDFYEKNTIPLYMLLGNSKFHYIIINNIDDKDNYFFSFFYKNGLDLFLFRSNKWINFSPGIGCTYYYNKIQCSVGYNYNIGYDFSNTMKNHYMFIELAFNLF